MKWQEERQRLEAASQKDRRKVEISSAIKVTPDPQLTYTLREV